MQTARVLVLATMAIPSALGANLQGTTRSLTAAESEVADIVFPNEGWCSGSKSGFSAVSCIHKFDVTATECKTFCADDVNCDAVNYAPSLKWHRGKTNFCQMYGAQIEYPRVGWTTCGINKKDALKKWPDTGIEIFPTKYKITCVKILKTIKTLNCFQSSFCYHMDKEYNTGMPNAISGDGGFPDVKAECLASDPNGWNQALVASIYLKMGSDCHIPPVCRWGGACL